MKAKKIEIFIDTENQVVKQVLEGDFDKQDAQYLTIETERKIHELKNQDKIDILVYMPHHGKPDAGARKILTENLARHNVHKIAMVSTSPVQRAIVNLVNIVTRSKKLKIVATETKAISWLHSD